MDILLLDDNNVKITLTHEDMMGLELEYDTLDYSAPHVRKVLIKILEKAKTQVGFAPKNAKLFVEAYPTKEKGCVLYITAVPKSQQTLPLPRKLRPYIYEFDDVDDLLKASALSHSMLSQRIFKSALYDFNGKYRMIVYPLDFSDNRSLSFLNEFGFKIGSGDISAAYTQEHGKEIIGENAIEILAKNFA